MRRDIDIAHDWIPVIPVQHYFMGGIETDLCARTNVKNLFACGESACTGVHGANRLASNSLLECLVFGKRCADAINNADVPPIRAGAYEQPKQSKSAEEYDLESFCTEIRELMTRKCSIIRNEEELLQAQTRVREVLGLLDEADLNTLKAVETYNIASTADEIIGAAQLRKQSIGAHYRSDDLGGK
jgi:L-aspartate oxidase